MKFLNVYLADGTYDGSITMSSSASKFTAIRVKKYEISQYINDLNLPGVYMLLIDDDTVYVGQSGLDSVGKRILNTHSGDIDSRWHTVIGFCCIDRTISSNQLLFIENALCEYTHKNYGHCITSTPSKTNCNATYRNKHYNLSSKEIHTCNQYFEDIKYYIESCVNSIFGTPSPADTFPGKMELFYYKNSSRNVYGKAEILTHCGNTRMRKTVLKAGSRISSEVSVNFRGYQSIINKRKQMEVKGVIENHILKEDIEFDSQSGAGQFLNGTSFDGNSNWKTEKGDIKLKEIL